MLATAVAALSFAAPPAARLSSRRAVATMRDWGVEAGRLDDAEAQDLLDEAQAESSEGALYCLNVKLCIKPEVREPFLECIRANQRGTLSSAEPLAVTYVFGEDESTPNTFHFFEQYRGVEGFEAHTKSPHFADWETFAATEPFTEPPVVSFYTEDAPGRAGLAPASAAPLFCLHVALHVKPERRNAFLGAMRGDQEGALTTEPACASYLFGEDANEPNTFHMYEAYAYGRAGFEAHAKSESYAAWSAFKQTDPFSRPATVSYFTLFDAPPPPPPRIADAERLTFTNEASGGGEAMGDAPAGFVWGGVF